MLCFTPPSNLHYGWQPSHVLGVPEPPSTNVWEPWKCPPTSHLGSPWAAGRAQKLAKTRTRAGLLATEGGALDYGGRLWRDCGDATLSLRLPHRYRESFCLACAAGVRIKKTAQNSNSGRFFHRRGPRSMPRKEPPSRRSLATERLPDGGRGEGGRGAGEEGEGGLVPVTTSFVSDMTPGQH